MDPDGGMSGAQKTKLLPIVPMFHTCFNVCNTGVLIWFCIPQLEKVVCKLIKPKGDKEDEDFRFVYRWHREEPRTFCLRAQQEIGLFRRNVSIVCLVW